MRFGLSTLPLVLGVFYGNQFPRELVLISYKGTGVGTGGSEFAVLGKNL